MARHAKRRVNGNPLINIILGALVIYMGTQLDRDRFAFYAYIGGFVILASGLDSIYYMFFPKKNQVTTSNVFVNKTYKDVYTGELYYLPQITFRDGLIISENYINNQTTLPSRGLIVYEENKYNLIYIFVILIPDHRYEEFTDTIKNIDLKLVNHNFNETIIQNPEIKKKPYKTFVKYWEKEYVISFRAHEVSKNKSEHGHIRNTAMYYYTELINQIRKTLNLEILLFDLYSN